MRTRIISAFPACGKTYAFKKLNQKGYTILDSDSSKFSWVERRYTEYELQKLKEEWNSPSYLLSSEQYIDLIRYDKIKVRNPKFPNNYIQWFIICLTTLAKTSIYTTMPIFIAIHI